MRDTHYILAALCFTVVASCTSSENKSESDQKLASDTIVADTGISQISKSITLDSTDTKFLKNVALSNLTTIELANKMIQLGAKPNLISLAKELVSDHKAYQVSLENLAKKKGYQLPQTLPQTPIQNVKKLETYEKEDRNEYFLQSVIEEYQKTIDRFGQATTSKDADIAAFATLTKPKWEVTYGQSKKLEKELRAQKTGQGNDPRQ